MALPGSNFCVSDSTLAFLLGSPKPYPRVNFWASTHRKHNHDLSLSLYNDSEVIPDLEAPECLMNEYIADLGGRYEACIAGQEVRGREGTGLDAEGTQG